MTRTRQVVVTMTAALWLGCAGPGSPGPVSSSTTRAPPDPAVIDVDAVVALTTGLLLAANTGEAELWRALEERLGARAIRTSPGITVASSSTPPTLTLVVDLRDIPACHDPAAGVVGGEPPRVLGCGARGLAALAVFIVVAERHDDVDLLIVDGPVSPGPAVAWVAGAGGIVRSDDLNVFDVGVVDAGVLDVRLRLAGDVANVDVVVAAVGRALAWRGRERVPQVLQDRARALPRRPWAPAGDPFAGLASSQRADLTRERCRLREPPTAAVARLRCHVLPGADGDDVIAGMLRAVDDDAVVLEVEAVTPPTATPWQAPLVEAVRQRLADEGIAAAPMLEVDPGGSLCGGWRQVGAVCVSGTPLALHPAARGAVGTSAESVDVLELGRLAGRVEGVLRLLRQSTEGG